MEVVGWEGGRREGGRRVGVLREKATSVLHAYFIKQKWRDGSERPEGRGSAGPGRGAAGPRARGGRAGLGVQGGLVGARPVGCLPQQVGPAVKPTCREVWGGKRRKVKGEGALSTRVSLRSAEPRLTTNRPPLRWVKLGRYLSPFSHVKFLPFLRNLFQFALLRTRRVLPDVHWSLPLSPSPSTQCWRFCPHLVPPPRPWGLVPPRSPAPGTGTWVPSSPGQGSADGHGLSWGEWRARRRAQVAVSGLPHHCYGTDDNPIFA